MANIYTTGIGEKIDLDNFDEVKANLDKLSKDDWARISQYQKLSEPFIEKHKDCFNSNIVQLK